MDRVVGGLTLRLVLVGGEETQRGESARVVLAWVGRREAEEGQRHLRVDLLLLLLLLRLRGLNG